MGVTDLVANSPFGARQRPSTSADVTPGLVEGFRVRAEPTCYDGHVERLCARDEPDGASERAFQPEQEALFVLLASVSRRIAGRISARRPLMPLRVVK
jgi:hypothetical protein